MTTPVLSPVPVCWTLTDHMRLTLHQEFTSGKMQAPLIVPTL